jgi:hypothetical protein
MNSNVRDPNNANAHDAPVDFVALLWDELAEIQQLRQNRLWTDGDVPHGHTRSRRSHNSEDSQEPGKLACPTPDEVFHSAHKQELVGLAFSGGGIRSATFNLGVLQGFAELGLLPMFDYLSTVSGGGYIGGWYEAWIYRAALDPRVAQCTELSSSSEEPVSGIWRVQKCLTADRSDKIDHSEALALRFLREYSNYLTPRLGFLGADTWTAAAIYVRNLLLNQVILIHFIFFLLLIPYLTVYVTNRFLISSGMREIAPVATFVLILVAQLGVSRNMFHLTGDDSTGEFPPSARQWAVLTLVVAPLILAAWFLSVWMWNKQTWTRPWWLWLVLGLFGFGLTWSVAAFSGSSKSAASHESWNSRRTALASMGFSVISSAFAGWLLWILADKVFSKCSDPNSGVWNVVSFGPPLTVVAFLLVATLQLGLMGCLTPDPRREWWGRLGAWLLILSVTWAAAFALAIYSPLAVMWSRRFMSSATLVWIFSTLTGVLGGKSGKTGSSDSPSWKDTALSVTPYVFVIGLAVALATVLEIVLAVTNRATELAILLKGSQVTQKVTGWTISLDWSWIFGSKPHTQGTVISTPGHAVYSQAFVTAHWQILSALLNWKLPVCASITAIVCLFIARRVDLNEFSMNLFYRNRLVRCYLGASHKFRRPNPFTGFDPSDDLLLSNLRSTNGYSGPFPIVNTALNLVKGQNLAWQERKAESFVITPFRIGFDTWLERLDLNIESSQMSKRGIQEYGYRPTESYAYRHGLRMGTAVSISGAAASPNMGYHSVPSLAFLMTFFNVRLGFWAGNPRHDSTWTMPGPRFGFFQLLAELFGLTDDEARYVYLSDGGHFENLGLYELIKRRCQYIVVSDADCDNAYGFGDLGNAIRKCREDIGVEITIVTDNLAPKKTPVNSNQTGSGNSKPSLPPDDDFSKWHWAIGRIQYSLVDPKAADGILVYLKTSLTGDEPADVLNYHRQHTAFPHETTADQWFTESQFESYRRLGQHVIEKLFEHTAVAKMNTGDIFRGLEKKWQTQ